MSTFSIFSSSRAVLTVERLSAFKFALPVSYTNYIAFYARHNSSVNINHLAANISLQVYLCILMMSCCYVVLLALTSREMYSKKLRSSLLFSSNKKIK
jgi:hypothetical protein